MQVVTAKPICLRVINSEEIKLAVETDELNRAKSRERRESEGTA